MRLPRKHLAICCGLIAAIILVFHSGISDFAQQSFVRDNGSVDKILSTSTPLIREDKTTSLPTVREIQQDKVTTKDTTTILSDKTITRPNHLIQTESATTRPRSEIDSNPITTPRPSVSLLYVYDGTQRRIQDILDW